MKRLSKQEQRKIQLNILSHFIDFCETNGLRYFLDGGSLLGAIRHNGYIP
jgi:lipopolysaccharide cholinephosphotransferase